MARPKGSKNKATLAREAAQKINRPTIDKTGKVIQNGQEVGMVGHEDGVFIAANYITQKRVRSGDYDEAERWLLQSFDC